MDRSLRVAVIGAALLLLGTQGAFAGSPPYTDGPDIIVTDNKKDNVRGGAGRDIIDTRGGADVLRGDKNSDDLYGGDGPDTYYGNAGNDYLSEYSSYEPEPDIAGGDGDGFTGHDVLDGGDGADFIEGARGDDVIYGGDGSDKCEGDDDCVNLYGDTGNDTIYGGLGDDDMEGEQGDDRLYGNAGDDWIDAADDENVGHFDYVDCGPGHDVAVVNEDDTVVNCEVVETVPAPTAEATAASIRRGDRAQAAARAAFLAANPR
jgi:Ca2+-binding RTX toxin-like protein